jgi:thiol-disulfide isomerase/thioredoxin
MRLGVRMLAAAALAVMATAAIAAADLRLWGDKATPRLAGVDLAGQPYDLKQFRGRVVLVNFWATWCEPCRDEMPSLQKLREKMKGRPFEIVAVNYGESRSRVASFVQKEGWTLPIVLDPDKVAAAAWGAKGLPMSFLVDATGRVRYWTFGERDWSEGLSVEAVDKLLAEAPRAG